MNTDMATHEQAVHGVVWNTLHGGYFSDPEVARPLLERVMEVCRSSRAEVVVDWGGGTGFLLARLASQWPPAAPPMRWVNVDCSNAQIEAAAAASVECLARPIDGFQRDEIASDNARFLFMMRSVLHYVGETGLLPLLRRLRETARMGEYWVHQTAVFEDTVAAACFNALYTGLRTRKWFPTDDYLRDALARAGWRLELTEPAPALRCTTKELAGRYGLSPEAMARVQSDVTQAFGVLPGVWQPNDGGAIAWLHYRIYTCLAC